MNNDSGEFDDQDEDASPMQGSRLKRPPAAKDLADELDTCLQVAPALSPVHAAEQFELRSAVPGRQLRRLLELGNFQRSRKEFKRRWKAVKDALGMWTGAWIHARDEAPDCWRHVDNHTRGLIAWLHDLELPVDARAGTQGQGSPALPPVVTTIRIQLDPPEIEYLGEKMFVKGCDDALRMLRKLQAGQKVKPDPDSALQQNTSRLRKQMRAKGKPFSRLADHIYKRGSFGLWPTPKPQRSRSTR